jgi:hypothetical protein
MNGKTIKTITRADLCEAVTEGRAFAHGIGYAGRVGAEGNHRLP